MMHFMYSCISRTWLFGWYFGTKKCDLYSNKYGKYLFEVPNYASHTGSKKKKFLEWMKKSVWTDMSRIILERVIPDIYV